MSSLSSGSSVGTGSRRSAVLFDMDGTLTRPVFDFDLIRREIGLPAESRTPILEAMEEMSPARRERAMRILLRHEERVAMTCELWEDTRSVLTELRHAGWATAVITRNSRVSAETVVRRHSLVLDVIHTREDGPVKPAPDPVLAVCRRLEIMPAEAWVVGDYLFDLQSGNAAGAKTVLMIDDAEIPPYASCADHVIRRLSELLSLLGLVRA